MARSDSLGIFWQDVESIKAPKAEKPKRTPPEPTWLSQDYLPGLQEALEFKVDLYNDLEIQEFVNSRLYTGKKTKVVFDIECYYNYFLAAFMSIETKKVTYVEMCNNDPLNIAKLNWILNNFCLVTFNGVNYDIPIVTLALAGKNCYELKEATHRIIIEGARPSDVLKSNKVKSVKFDHIDLIEVAPLFASLKVYAGRLHAQKMQDLPFPPDTILSPEQISIIRWYCINDLTNTELLHNKLIQELTLRENMGQQYGMDLRSKSDAQIAESVITEAIERLNGVRAQRPSITPGTRYKYTVPAFINYKTPLMNWALDIVRNADFIVSEFGNIGIPPVLSDLKINIANGVYRMGIGGLHSSEKSTSHISNENTILSDRDVVSFYPIIILNQQLFPQHLGQNFLVVYKQLVEMRLSAKRSGNKVIADSLKITINGSFGKFGSMYSVLYSPQLVIQVTISGQLSLLMLIERLELVGIPVVSANTDGIVIKCPSSRKAEMDAIVKQWEKDTQYETEETLYKALYSRDVNNYIAIKEDGKPKTKGVYSSTGLSKNPTNEICVEALLKFLSEGVPISVTIRNCEDITKFVSVRTVKGSAVKNGVYLGKSIRWYYGTGEEAKGEMVVAKNGNKVPRSDGAIPLMELPSKLPDNVDYDWYEKEAYKMLEELAYKLD